MKGDDLSVDYEQLRDAARPFVDRGLEGQALADQVAGALNFGGGALPCGYDETGKNYLESVLPVARMAHQALQALGEGSVMLGDLVKAFANSYQGSDDRTTQLAEDVAAEVEGRTPSSG